MQTKEQIKEIMKNEKDLYIWKDWEFICVISRHRWHLNWYVWVNKQHPLYEKNYSFYIYKEDRKNYKEDFLKIVDYIDNIEIHWWLTFSDRADFKTNIEWYNFQEYWFFGFDTAHFLDNYIDELSWYNSINEEWIYKDYKYVKKEVDSLVKQFKNYS